jgi:hypothetical protein
MAAGVCKRYAASPLIKSGTPFEQQQHLFLALIL